MSFDKDASLRLVTLSAGKLAVLVHGPSCPSLTLFTNFDEGSTQKVGLNQRQCVAMNVGFDVHVAIGVTLLVDELDKLFDSLMIESKYTTAACLKRELRC
jgi:hypothetical protein